jgi:hypothetical protein
MQKRFLTTAVAGVATMALVASATPASAQYDAADAKCHATIAKNVGKYIASLGKQTSGCYKSVPKKASAGTECFDATIGGDSDLKAKQSGARAKAVAGIAKACNDTDHAEVIALYGRCPSPAASVDDGGATTGIDTISELSNCLLTLAEEEVTKIARETMGTTDNVNSISATAGKCRAAVAKSVSSVIAGYGKDRAGCMKANYGNSFQTNCGTDSPGDDAGGKVAGTVAKLKAAIDKSCVAVTSEEFKAMGLCGTTTSSLKSCVGDEIAVRGARGLAAMTYELPSDCGARVDRVGVFINPGNNGAGELTNTVLSTGYTGLAHGADVIEGFEGSVNITCDEDCANCSVTVDTTKTRPTSTCRCRNDSSLTCDTLNGADADDCGGNQCDCLFGPPLALNAAGAPVCVVNRIAQEIGQGGSDGADIGTGDSTTTVVNNAVVHLGISQSQPCPTCEGDNAANDGNANGTCNGGARDGLSCDQNGDHAVFGPVSYGCMPEAVQNISGASGLPLNLVLSTGMSSLSSWNIPCDDPMGENCPCGTCSGNKFRGCSQDSDCSDVGEGLCDNSAGDRQIVRDNCTTACTDGECPDDFVSFCGGPNALVRADGTGIVTCTTDADCDNTDCGNGTGVGLCGTCSIFENRKCFSDPVEVVGEPGTYGSDLAAAFCNGQTTNAGTDGAGGLPGAAALVLNFDYEGHCPNGDLAEGPGMSNCQ